MKTQAQVQPNQPMMADRRQAQVAPSSGLLLRSNLKAGVQPAEMQALAAELHSQGFDVIPIRVINV